MNTAIFGPSSVVARRMKEDLPIDPGNSPNKRLQDFS